MSAWIFRHDASNGAKLTQGVKYFGGGNSKTGPDGFYRVKCDNFSIQSLDTTGNIQFSFDSTNWLLLPPGASLTMAMIADRYYYKTTDGTTWWPSFQVAANIRENGG